MKYCSSCKIHVNNKRNTCPFCYSVLEDDGSELTNQEYPKYVRKKRLSMATKILLFISIVVCLASLLVNIYTVSIGDKYYWSIFVFAAFIYLWIILKYVFTSRGVVTERIITTAIITGFVIFLIELLFVKSTTLWFSIAIVIPFIFMATILIVLIFMMANRKLVIDTLFSLFGFTLLLMVPLLVCAYTNMLLWPSIICASMGAVTLIYMLVFHTRDVTEEFKKRLHI